MTLDMDMAGLMRARSGSQQDWGSLGDFSMAYVLMHDGLVVGSVTSHLRFSDLTSSWGYAFMSPKDFEARSADYGTMSRSEPAMTSGEATSREACMSAVEAVWGQGVTLEPVNSLLDDLDPMDLKTRLETVSVLARDELKTLPSMSPAKMRALCNTAAQA